MDLIYLSFRSSNVSGGDGVERDSVILAICEHHLIRVHDNLVQHPINNILIKYTLSFKEPGPKTSWLRKLKLYYSIVNFI